ncbi:MAG: hypothetical protein H6839_17880 [Planctomycetes bacterium]|nr:hypothetical protein [Planctomycetota bacterium]
MKVSLSAIRAHFGALEVFQVAIRPRELHVVLGHDPRHERWLSLTPEHREHYEHVQRRTTKERAEKLEAYILNRFPCAASAIGAFPAISIGATEPLEFSPTSEGADVGNLGIPSNSKRILLDGMARATATLNLIDAGHPDVDDWFQFPLTIYAPSAQRGHLTISELGQLFFDFNYLATAVRLAHGIALDENDIYIRMTNALAELKPIVDYGMEKRTTSLGKKSTAIVVQKNLLRFVRGACEGAKVQESNKAVPRKANLTDATFDDTLAKLAEFLTTFREAFPSGAFEDRQSLHLSSPGWQALGRVYFDLNYNMKRRLEPAKYDEYVRRLAAIDWSRGNQKLLATVGRLVPGRAGKPQLKLTGAGRSIVSALHEHLRLELELHSKLKDSESGTDMFTKTST